MTVSGEGERPADFLIGTHLVTRGENWKLQLTFVRTIDGKILTSRSDDFAEADFGRIADQVLSDLLSALVKEAEIVRNAPPGGTQVQASELDHYLFQFDQALAVRCGSSTGIARESPGNPAEILASMISLCLQKPRHLPSRILLWRVLDGLETVEPELVKSMAPKVLGLQADHPLNTIFQQSLDKEFNSILVA